MQGLSKPRQLIWRVHVQGCLRRSLPCAINVTEFFTLALRSCHYCGQPPSNFLKQYPDFRYNGVDRVDNAKPYDATNLVPCCKTCNSMKSALSQADFITHVRKIHRWQSLAPVERLHL